MTKTLCDSCGLEIGHFANIRFFTLRDVYDVCESCLIDLYCKMSLKIHLTAEQLEFADDYFGEKKCSNGMPLPAHSVLSGDLDQELVKICSTASN